MKNVVVHQGRDVVCDGELTPNVVSVNPPTRDSSASIEIQITGTITYLPDKYVPPPRQGEPKTWEREYKELVQRIRTWAPDAADQYLDGLQTP